MRSAIALCFLAVLCCIADATTLDILFRRVQKTKMEVESTIRQLKHIRENTQKDVELTVGKKLLQSLEEYNNYANSVLNTIRKEVEDAKARGRNAEPCYDAALNILKNIYNAAYIDAQQCRENATHSINNNLSFNDQLITTGHELINELDTIFPDCYNKYSRLIDIIKLHNCIIDQHGISKIGVQNLKRDASSAGSTAKSASKIVNQQSTDCLNKVFSITRLEVVRSTATRCLNNV
ncbi:PREDICTED: uncharacterized protein LOC108751321 [Trachymyrmex septentrionalis]|uniref:uncharacterized protein LOC108751321 n=1 Tax=Trachymyrmex septentrionalis TaxID=34720 RepID=UPI00084F311E|nr:PREDICTED: uncharacterized protein LOC108751321 [Trachymyrmex septentrionalis]